MAIPSDPGVSGNAEVRPGKHPNIYRSAAPV